MPGGPPAGGPLRPVSSSGSLPTLPGASVADSARLADMTGYGGTERRSFCMCLVEWHVTRRPTIGDGGSGASVGRGWLVAAHIVGCGHGLGCGESL